MKKNYFVFCDGGSRGNPGPAAIAFLVKNSQGKILFKSGKYIGKSTNNQAEYLAVIEALRWLGYQPTLNFKQAVINFFLDSNLVVNQLNGVYRVRNNGLKNMIIAAKQLEKNLKLQVNYRFITRDKNREADLLVNQSFPVR